jgi:pantoate--beta-alanine ligase
MEVCYTISELKQIIGDCKKRGEVVGFVPTMGALHHGHLSLVREASKTCSFVVASIFVNPTQFNDKDDLARYPRTLDADLAMLKSVHCNLVFVPTVEEVYPEPDNRVFDFGHLDKVMEGAHRPGHFNGVGQVVSKLFDMVEPHKAYFGQKDFQQLAIIKYMVKQMNYPIEIIPCPIVREPDGLAMSSRNTLLTPEQRENAALISQTLFEAANLKTSHSIDEIKQWIVTSIDKNPYLKTEYFEIVDDEQLLPINEWSSECNKVGCIAVHCGKIRLIDNINF